MILIQHYGAPSHIDLWDPKPDAPAEIRGEFKTIATSLPGYRVTEVMPRLARLYHRLTIVRSMTHRVANHNPASYLAITDHTPERDAVHAGRLASLRRGPGPLPATGQRRPTAVQVPHVAFDHVYKCPGQWGGLLGKRHGPFIVVGDPSTPGYRADELSTPADLNADCLDDRRGLLHPLDRQARWQELARIAHRSWALGARNPPHPAPARLRRRGGRGS